MSKNIIFLFTFIGFWLIFFPTSLIIPNPTYNGWLNNLLILVMLWYFRTDIRYFFGGKFRWFNISVFSFCIIGIVSIILNADTIDMFSMSRFRNGEEKFYTGITSPKQSIYYSLSTVVLTLFVERLSTEHKVTFFLNYLWKMSLFLWAWCNFDAFTHVVVGESIGGYIMGTKFQVGYYNLFVCTLYWYLHPLLAKRSEKIVMLMFLLVSFLSCVHTKCSTLSIGTFVFFMFIYVIPKRMRYSMSYGTFLVLSIVILDLSFFFFTTWFLQFPIAQEIIVNVLNEDLTLTGRLGIFEKITEAFENNLWLGYGNGNSRIVSLFYTGVENPQNGLIEVFLNTGLLGSVSFLAMVFFAAQQITGKDWYKYPLVTYVLVMIVVSTVEVPFEKTFVFLIILILLNQTELRQNIKEIGKWKK